MTLTAATIPRRVPPCPCATAPLTVSPRPTYMVDVARRSHVAGSARMSGLKPSFPVSGALPLLRARALDRKYTSRHDSSPKNMHAAWKNGCENCTRAPARLIVYSRSAALVAAAAQTGAARGRCGRG